MQKCVHRTIVLLVISLQFLSMQNGLKLAIQKKKMQISKSICIQELAVWNYFDAWVAFTKRKISENHFLVPTYQTKRIVFFF